MAKKRNATIRQISEASGFSSATVSLALRNHPRISEATKKTIQDLAEKMGYRPNPQYAKVMHQIRSNKPVNVRTALAVIHAQPSPELDRRPNTSYIWKLWQGIQERADELGYAVDAFWNHEKGLSIERIQRVIESRGIQGVLIFPGQDFEIKWSNYSIIGVGFTMPGLRIHRVMSNHRLAMLTSIRNCLDKGYKKVGIALAKDFKVQSNYVWGNIATWYAAQVEERFRVPFYNGSSDDIGGFQEWMLKYKPDTIITNRRSPFLESIFDGRVMTPKNFGYCLVNLTNRDSGIAGAYENPLHVGHTAVSQLSMLIYRNDRGLQESPNLTLTDTPWVNGESLPKIGEPVPYLESIRPYF